MTHFLEDILRQPEQLKRTIDFLCGAGQHQLRRVVSAIQKARHVYLTGIGSSWHATFGAGSIFNGAGQPVYMQDLGELVQFASFPADSVVIAISRSGRSVEIVNLLAKARECGAIVIGVTNSADGVLAQEAQLSLVISTPKDHAISVVTYSTLALAAAIVASASVGSFDSEVASSLLLSIVETARKIPKWQEQIINNGWFVSGKVAHFLARGGSLGSCYEARLLWQEGAKSEATALGTDSFRHGPQEMVAPGSRFGVWADARRGREQDFSVARDLKSLGASIFLIGQDLPPDAADLVFELPQALAEWQFIIDILPAQLSAEYLARLSGVDCDSFRICSYVVEEEYGLIGPEVATRKETKS